MKNVPLQLYEREKILGDCLSVFARHGYKNTTIGMLAEAAGISKALIFHHFKNKKKLYFSLLEHCYNKVGTALQADTVSENQDFFQAVNLFMRNKFDYYRKHSDESQLVYNAFYSIPDDLKEDMEEKYGHILDSKNNVWEQLFEKVPLREGVERKEAFELIMITLGHFDDKFLAEVSNIDVMDEEYAQNLFDKMIRLFSIIRHGITK